MEVSVATSMSWKNKETQQWDSKTTWHKLMFSGKQAESAAQKIDKGTVLFAEGPTVDEQWVDKHKQNRVTKAMRVETYRIVVKDNPSASNGMGDGQDNGMNPMTKEEMDEFWGES